MATPVDEYPDPFGDYAAIMTESPPGERSKEASGPISSAEGSRPQSRGRDKKKRVGFGADQGGKSPRISWVEPSSGTLSPPTTGSRSYSPDASGATTPHGHSRQGSGDGLLPLLSPSRSIAPDLSAQQTAQIHQAFISNLAVPRPRPAIRRTPSDHNTPIVVIEEEDDSNDVDAIHRKRVAREAFERGKRHELAERIRSEPNSRLPSPERPSSKGKAPVRPRRDIALEDLPPRTYDDTDDEDEGLHLPRLSRMEKTDAAEAQKLVRKHTMGNGVFHTDASSGLRSGAVTPTEEHGFFEDYKPRPDQYRGGVLGALLKLYNNDQSGSSHSRSSSVPKAAHIRSDSGDTAMYSADPTPTHSPTESGASTPVGGKSSRHWYSPKQRSQSSGSLAQLVGQSASLGSPSVTGLGAHGLRIQKELAARPGLGKRSRSANALAALHRMSRPKMEDEIRITVHIAQTISRQRYLMKLCKALMQYGAPTHRLEEYLQMSARVLEIDAQFLYIPGSMIMSFDDQSTHTTEVKLVKVQQGLDLGKLRDVHEVYKEVVHDLIFVEEATTRLKEITSRKNKHSRWVLIPVYGLASVCVGPFAFEARLIDLPISFLLGCILGVLQLVVAPRSDLYANVFEIAATVITSFLARAFGSINGGNTFCFSALAQSSIALILPGYTVLCASLELQSRSIVAGSVRMVYAIIYSFFLGFGITIGTAIYGIIDKNAVSDTSCHKPMTGYWFFFFVPAFAMCLIVINQAKWKQAPVMLVIAFAGYVVNFFSSKRFAGNTQVSNTLGALAIGVLANSYSRMGSRAENFCLDIWEDRLRPKWKSVRNRVRSLLRLSSKSQSPPNKMEEGHAGSDAESLFVRQTRRVGYGLAAAAMLPAIFVQVPSGLAVSGSLVSGIASANQITGNATNGSSVVNSTTLTLASSGLNSIALNVGYSVIQVAIGITVGLFLSAIVVYPFGKKRSGLFSF